MVGQLSKLVNNRDSDKRAFDTGDRAVLVRLPSIRVQEKEPNESRRGGGGGGGHDADDCYLSSGGIFWWCTRKILLVDYFVEIHTSNTKPTPANSVQQNIVQRQSKAIAFPSRFPTSSFLFARIGAYPPSGPK